LIDLDKHERIAPSMSSPLRNVFYPPEDVQPHALKVLPQAKAAPKKQARPRQKRFSVKPTPTLAAIPTATPVARPTATSDLEWDKGNPQWENVSHCRLLDRAGGHQVCTVTPRDLRTAGVVAVLDPNPKH